MSSRKQTQTQYGNFMASRQPSKYYGQRARELRRAATGHLSPENRSTLIYFAADLDEFAGEARRLRQGRRKRRQTARKSGQDAAAPPRSTRARHPRTRGGRSQ